MSELTIKSALEKDASEISEFICVHFNGSEPIQLFHVRKDEKMDPPPADLVNECLESQTTLLAYQGDKLVGVLIAGEINSNIADKDLEYAGDYGPKGVDVFNMLSYIGEKADICNRLEIPRSLHIHILSVHVDHKGQGIATKLFKACIESGRQKKFPAFSVDCTSFYTAKIAESFGMNCVSCVTYDEYNEKIGEKLFAPSEPHTVIKTYVRLYDEK
jgi:ribosomal protein S18 acetylase RimI-like enzyme